ncbi:acetate/propionate family kinase [Rhodoblastus sp.]|uniref:acetate/propionate family kinase n=1 Tax=Rhodoblastus sp. TaxID=1962975 RepID=UPI0035AE6A6A
MADCIAVINAGSSSIKFAIYDASTEGGLAFKGQIEGIGVAPHLKIVGADGAALNDRRFPKDGFDHDVAMREIIAASRALLGGSEVVGFGHRVVHGGVQFDKPIIVTKEVLDELAKLCPLAPLHQPHNLAPIRTVFEVAAHKPQVACFDTAFHRSQPSLAQTYALPRRFTEDGVRRYGFHGISYEYLTSRFRELAPDLASGRIVFAHLGNGASLCAVKDGRSIANTMGFTAVEGLMMGTRCGSIDPGIVLHLMQHYGMDAQAIEDVIYKKSGLLGVSGLSPDMRSLRASSAPEAREAIALFVYRIVRELGSLAAALGGLDALVFSGGIGEHDVATRAEVVDGCRWIGAALDAERNARGELRISHDQSRVSIWAIPTDEERMIARHTRALLS